MCPAPAIERVLVVFPGALGDFLLALPALRSLNARHPSAHITAVVSEPLRALATRARIAECVASLDAADAAGLFGGDALPPWLADRPLVYSWLGARDDGTRGRIRRAAHEAHFFHVERGPGTPHAAVAYARAVQAPLEGRALADAARIVAGPSPAADDLLAAVRAPVLAVHPGAGARAKRWDAAGFVQLAQWWRQHGGGVIEIAGPAEAGDPLLLGAPAARDLPLADLADVLARVTLYVGNDSGVSHLAGAVGVPGIVLFGPTDSRRWRPVGPQVGVLQARAAGADGITLAALPVTRVLAAVRRRITLTTPDPDISVPA